MAGTVSKGLRSVYQSIDDPQEELDALECGDKRVVIWLFTAICLVLVFAIVYWTSPSPKTLQPNNDIILAEQVTYRKAISETRAPMRRARLKDFITTYPESRYMRAVQAQLDAINAHETAEWINVTNTAFAPTAKRDDKLAALKAYETQWGGALLGGRDTEIQTLREEILETKDIDPLPNRKLKNLKSPIPETVPDTLLAGGPRPVISPPVIVAPPVIKSIIPKVVELEIVQPRARRERAPIYPRNALRRNIKATVTLSLNINEKGKVKMIDVLSVEAERYEKDFVKAAKRAARRTSYYPKTVDGQPRAASGVVKRYKFDPDA